MFPNKELDLLYAQASFRFQNLDGLAKTCDDALRLGGKQEGLENLSAYVFQTKVPALPQAKALLLRMGPRRGPFKKYWNRVRATLSLPEMQ